MFLVKSLLLSLFVVHSAFGLSDYVVDTTEEAFGIFFRTKDMWPLAFVDFNSDRIADMAVVDDSTKTLSVFLGSKEKFYGIVPPLFNTNASQELGLECKLLSEGHMVSVVPADFDGDGNPELLVLIQMKPSANYFARLIWHFRDERGSRLDCSQLNNSTSSIEMISQPIVLDANGDSIADLFGVNANGTKGFWIFSSERYSPPIFQAAQVMSDSDQMLTSTSLKKIQSNAFVDLNEDGNADIIFAIGNSFEIWENVGGATSLGSDQNSTSPNFRYSKTVKLSNCDSNCLVGQAAFSDFDRSGRLSIIFPVCHDGIACQSPELYTAKVADMMNEGKNFIFTKVFVNFDKLTFHFLPEKSSFNPYTSLMPRVGDFDLDGYPDLLLRMKNVTSGAFTSQVLLNIPYETFYDFKRGFQIQPQIIGASENVLAAAFFDMTGNGVLDILAIQDAGNDHTKLAVYSNKSLTASGYFLKVKVLTGICYQNCKSENLPIPFGSNLPGQSVCYRSQSVLYGKPKNSDFDSCLPQLTQTSYAALQMPYVHFGLSSDLIYIEELEVTVTNASDRSQKKSFIQMLIPNANIYAITHPPSKPDEWRVKMFVFIGRNTFFIGITFFGLTGILLFSFVFLHFKELRADRLEHAKDAADRGFQTM